MVSFTHILNQIASPLIKTNQQLVTAESCTGGLLGALITEVPGSSQWYERGFITYSNLAKQEMLGVKESLLVEFGAVSIEVATAMAVGALQHSRAAVAVSVTGVAGPGGGSIEKPVGTVCFAWAYQGRIHSVKKHFDGDRQAIRLAACQQALEGVLSIIKEID